MGVTTDRKGEDMPTITLPDNTQREYEKPLTAEQISKIIGCTPQHIYQMAQQNKLPHFRIGSHVRFPANVIETHILKGTNNEDEV